MSSGETEVSILIDPGHVESSKVVSVISSVSAKKGFIQSGAANENIEYLER